MDPAAAGLADQAVAVVGTVTTMVAAEARAMEVGMGKAGVEAGSALAATVMVAVDSVAAVVAVVGDGEAAEEDASCREGR